MLDQTRGQLHFQPARDLMQFDAQPCEAMLLVEFYDDHVPERLARMQARGLGLRSQLVTDAREMDMVWGVRKAGLSLLTGCVGAAKPVAFIEDAAVRPAQLPEYVRGLQSIMHPLGLDASYYGHAASGLLHVRPVVDLHCADDLKKFRLVADQTSALVKQFKGSLAATAAGAAALPVILWDDTFVRYNEPHIGKAAVQVLVAIGYQVSLARRRKCCGRPAFSQGSLDIAASFGKHNVALFSALPYSNTPIIFLEPSCYSMFVDDYRELKISGAEELAKRCFLFEQFGAIGERGPEIFSEHVEPVAIHAHCHAKSLLRTGFMAELAEKLPRHRAKVLETGCCGMAGAFGMTECKRELSLQVAAPLLQKIAAEPAESIIVASGTSCRHQISELSSRRPKHMAEVMAEALK